MKNIQAILAALMLTFFGATSAQSEFVVGVSGSFAMLSADGSETEGGEKTKDGITVAISRTHIWDQPRIDELLEDTPRSEWPSFVSQHTSYKIDMRSFQTYAMNHPKDSGKWHDAHSIKLGDPKVKTIKAENIKEA